MLTCSKIASTIGDRVFFACVARFTALALAILMPPRVHAVERELVRLFDAFKPPPPAPEAKTFADAEGTETEKTEETETVRGGDGAGDAVTEPNEGDAL